MEFSSTADWDDAESGERTEISGPSSSPRGAIATRRKSVKDRRTKRKGRTHSGRGDRMWVTWMQLELEAPELSVRNAAVISHRALGAGPRDSAEPAAARVKMMLRPSAFGQTEAQHLQGFRRQVDGRSGFPPLAARGGWERCSHASWLSKFAA